MPQSPTLIRTIASLNLAFSFAFCKLVASPSAFLMPEDNEANARINIDQLLREAGWDPSDRRQVNTEVHVQLTEGPDRSGIATESTVFQVKPKRADYVLHASDGKPLAVVEAKKSAVDPYRAKDQALAYARAMGTPFIFLSNGDSIYFWDYHEGDARPVASFFSQRDLERIIHKRQNRKDLALVPLPEDYIKSGEVRFVRPYQQDCMAALDSAILLGKQVAAFADGMASYLPRTWKSHAFLWSEKLGGRRFHARYVLTDVGGTGSEYGLDQGNSPGDETDLYLLPDPVRIRRIRDFSSTSDAFSLSGGPIDFTGIRG